MLEIDEPLAPGACCDTAPCTCQDAPTDRLAEIQARDSRTLAAAPASSDDWDDATWAAWSRCADRAHTRGGEGELARLRAENAELRTQLATAERQLRQLDDALADFIAIPGEDAA